MGEKRYDIKLYVQSDYYQDKQAYEKSKKKKPKVIYGVWIVVASAVNYNIYNF